MERSTKCRHRGRKMECTFYFPDFLRDHHLHDKNTFCQVSAFYYSIYCFSIFSRRPSQIVQKVHSVLFDFQSFRRDHPNFFYKMYLPYYLISPFARDHHSTPGPMSSTLCLIPRCFFLLNHIHFKTIYIT